MGRGQRNTLSGTWDKQHQGGSTSGYHIPSRSTSSIQDTGESGENALVIALFERTRKCGL
jgi:hypothetical protein